MSRMWAVVTSGCARSTTEVGVSGPPSAVVEPEKSRPRVGQRVNSSNLRPVTAHTTAKGPVAVHWQGEVASCDMQFQAVNDCASLTARCHSALVSRTPEATNSGAHTHCRRPTPQTQSASARAVTSLTQPIRLSPPSSHTHQQLPHHSLPHPTFTATSTGQPVILYTA